MAAPTLTRIRRLAVSHSLFAPTTLQGAIDRLGFVQADPIRSPARAQDLILRHRVAEYRAGDLERNYGSLDVEEDSLYAYGFVSRRVWRLLHPRKSSRMPAFQQQVLETVRSLREAHPRELEQHLGRRRVVNAWGGYSKATTHALEWLHWRGLLRIARREAGIRVYVPAAAPSQAAAPAERLRELTLVYARIFAPAPRRSLSSLLARYRAIGNTRDVVDEMIHSGELRTDTADGVVYVSPGDGDAPDEVPVPVRFAADCGGGSSLR